ncbi:integrase domain-containing protein [Lonsdalea populi]|nr:integrase domain-containing protein [Lonsdalea populi]
MSRAAAPNPVGKRLRSRHRAETALAYIDNIRKMLHAPMKAGDLAAQVMQARGWKPRPAWFALPSRPAALTKRRCLLERRSCRRSSCKRWPNRVEPSQDNTQLGVPERRYVTNISKAQELGTGLERVTDAHVRMSLQLQAAFGLRRKEPLLFQPDYADRGDHIVLKGSLTKGGRERTVPITTTKGLPDNNTSSRMNDWKSV